MILSINWANTFAVIVIGFGLVFVVLILLVYIIKFFGFVANKKDGNSETRKELKLNATEVKEGGFSDCENAAIALALNLYYADVHDEESYVITIDNSKKTSWNSKIYGLNNFFR
jgi:glutaconyl-CoA/methylmalonyl-CoA decarboxylase subunit delta